MKSLLVRLLLVVSIALAPALALELYRAYEARQTRQALIEDEALRLVGLVGAEQKRIAEGADQVLTVLGSAAAVLEQQPELCQRLLTNLLEQSSRYTSAIVAGADGHFICVPAGWPRDGNSSNRTFFRLAMQTGSFVVDGFAVSLSNGRPVLHMAKPFKNADGTIAGVAIVALDLGWLSQQLDQISLPKQAIAIIVDRDGTILARRPNLPGIVGKKIPDANRFALAGSRIGILETTSLETNRRLVMAYLPPAADAKGLAIGVGLDRDITFVAVTEANQQSMWLIAAAIVLSLAGTTLVGTHLIRRPFKRLLAVADRWRSGDLAARSGLAGDSSEFGRLAVAFDTMAAEQAARERARRAALEGTTDCVMVMDRDDRITYLNERAKALMPRGRDLQGEKLQTVFLNGEATIFTRACEAATRDSAPARLAGYVAPLECHIEVHAYPGEDGVSLFFRDVTDDHRRAVALQESEELYRATFDQAPVGMAQTTLDGTWLRINEATSAITGYSYDEMIGRTFYDITHPDDRDADTAQVDTLLAGRTTACTLEMRYVRQDGSIVWVNRWVSVLRNAAGRPYRLIAMIVDITERKSTQAALQESETRLRLAREAAGFGVWDWDLITGLSIWSEQQWRLRGLEPRHGRVEHETWCNGIHDQDRERVLGEISVAVADPARPFDTSYRIVRPDGAIRWLLVKATVVRDPQGKPLRMVGVSTDVTESRETETALRQLSNELEVRVQQEIDAREAAQARAVRAERMQALGQLAAGIAHDFNNVLQMVLGSATLIEADPEDAKSVAGLAHLIIEAADQGTATTRRLLTLGRHGDLRTETLDVASLLQGLREILVHTLGSAVTVEVRVAPGLPPLLADKAQLELSLVNLAVNARDAMHLGGRLVLAAAGESIAEGHTADQPNLAPGDYIRLCVTDNGVGIDAGTLARVGEPFFTTKKVGAGTGLGVAMVRGFAEQSKGAMRLESRVGQGTTVTLWLPAAPRGRSVDPACDREGTVPSDTSRAGTASRILLVDDETRVRDVLARHLARNGFQVLVGADGHEALALLDAGENVDALVTDLSMPGMDGISLIRSAQERRPGMPAVLLTGYAGDGVNLAISGAVSGAYSLLRKPVRSAQLVDRIRALLAGRADASL